LNVSIERLSSMGRGSHLSCHAKASDETASRREELDSSENQIAEGE
jgi:hypothetical protein